jgi:AmmeMemoRadiSam system protein B
MRPRKVRLFLYESCRLLYHLLGREVLMSKNKYSLLLLSVLGLAMAGTAGADVGIREPADSVGYATVPGQVERIIAVSDSILDAGALPFALESASSGAGDMIGAIVPHDDYIYAGPYYTMVFERLKTDLVILFGVAHRARRIGLEGKLIFDDFDAWRGPYGLTRVSGLREKVVDSLPEELVLIDGDFHAAEHSLEGFIPFIQHYLGTEAEILPVLVTRLPGESWSSAVEAMTSALAGSLEKEGLALGTDVAILISADCVHYGDEEWGSGGYAPFGTGKEGYEKGTAQDIDIARATLEGEISLEKIAGFRERVERDDLENPYKVTWCGVYSIPFGIAVLGGLAEEQNMKIPEGHLLGYGTSLEPGALPVGGTGLGATAIATDRHWVGYLAMGYW